MTCFRNWYSSFLKLPFTQTRYILHSNNILTTTANCAFFLLLPAVFYRTHAYRLCQCLRNSNLFNFNVLKFNFYERNTSFVLDFIVAYFHVSMYVCCLLVYMSSICCDIFHVISVVFFLLAAAAVIVFVVSSHDFSSLREKQYFPMVKNSSRSNSLNTNNITAINLPCVALISANKRLFSCYTLITKSLCLLMKRRRSSSSSRSSTNNE